MKSFSFIILLLASVGVCTAATDTLVRNDYGDKALLCSIHPMQNFSINDFQGGIGYMAYFRKDWAFRLGFGFGSASSTSPKPANAEADDVTSDYSLDITPALRYNIGFASNVLAYTGAFCLFSFENHTEDGIRFLSNSSSQNTYGLGGGVLLGAEWFPCKNIGLSLEYSLQYKYSFGSVKYESGGLSQVTDLPSSTSFYIGKNSLLIIISVFFE